LNDVTASPESGRDHHGGSAGLRQPVGDACGGDGDGQRECDDAGADTSAVDTGCTVDVRTHHRQAVEMALIELGNGEDPDVIEVSARPDTTMAWMGTGVPYEQMPGLATESR
jgi:hypothetical protein